MRPRFSQNFLVRADIARAIVRALEIAPVDSVLEIGPGRGILTQTLLKEADSVTAVEIDAEISQGLEQRWGDYARFRVIRGDFLQVKLAEIFESPAKKVKVIGNLPYAVTSPILQKVLEWPLWSSAVFMVQKEVADRIRAKPGTKNYGVLTVSVQSRCRVEKVMKVSPYAFRPVPKVESTVLRLSPLNQALFGSAEEEIFFKPVKAAFAHRRKTAANSMADALDISAEEARNALQRSNLSPTARGETFSVEDFARLARILYN